MEDDPDLMDFNTWRVVQHDSDSSGVVFAANDHVSKSCSVWWAGPRTDFFERMQAEALVRGITLIVNHAPYSKSQIERAVDVITGNTDRLQRLGFDLQAVSGPTPSFLGLTIIGAPVGNEQAKQLAPELAVVVRDALADMLHDCEIHPDSVKVEHGRVHLL